MRKIFAVALTGLVIAALTIRVSHIQTAGGSVAGPQFTADGKLVRPEGYRRWVFVSSGLGMSYSQKASDDMQMFTNVFVNPASYDYFLAHGTWPDRLDVEVKDEKRFADKWAYYGFNSNEKAASPNTPGKNDCWQCHDQNAAVEHSFVQFYPELLKVAREKGTIKPTVHLEDKK